MKRQFGFYAFAALLVCAALVFGLSACSSGGDDGSALLAVTSGGSGTNPTSYTITFNANDGSENPASATQNFTAGTPQALRSITELGFSKSGFSFAGWGVSADASQASYADGASYTASSNATLYAIWSAIPVYSVNIPVNANGSVRASPATATAGTEITLSNTPKAGYYFASYSVTDADGEVISVTDGKFIMPAKDVNVTVVFNAWSYMVFGSGLYEYGRVTKYPQEDYIMVGTTVTVETEPALDCQLSDLSVTTTGVDKKSVPVSGTGNTRTFVMPACDVVVSATFKASPEAASREYVNVGTQTINGVDYDIVTFGLWPQTIKAESVQLTNETKTVGLFTYNKGSDGEWYVRQKENVYFKNQEGVKYSDGTLVAQSSDNSYKWFKVEPIKWRVLTTNYGGNKLLLAENALAGCIYYDYNNVNRTKDGAVIYPQNYEHSRFRAFLNGISYLKEANASSAYSYCGDFYKKGFLQTAFSAAAQTLIQPATVDNSARSTNPDANATLWNDGNNEYASDTPTIDKVFLLSEQEVTKSEYGFGPYDKFDSARVKEATDYAKAAGAPAVNDGCFWTLRSPNCDGIKLEELRAINGYGLADHREGICSYLGQCVEYGVVPVLCVEN